MFPKWGKNGLKKLDHYCNRFVKLSEVVSNAYHLLLTNWSNSRNQVYTFVSMA